MSFDPSQVQSHAGRIYLKNTDQFYTTKPGGKKPNQRAFVLKQLHFPKVATEQIYGHYQHYFYV